MYKHTGPLQFGPPTKYDEEEFNLSSGLQPPFNSSETASIIEDRLRHIRSRSSPSVSVDYARPFTPDTKSSRTPSIHSEQSRSSSSRASRKSSLLQPFYIAPRRASLGTGAHEARPPSLMSVAIASTSFSDSFSTIPFATSISSLHENEDNKLTILEPLQEYLDEMGQEADVSQEQPDATREAGRTNTRNLEADLDEEDERHSIISSLDSRYSEESSPVFVGQAQRLTLKPDGLHVERWNPPASKDGAPNNPPDALGIAFPNNSDSTTHCETQALPGRHPLEVAKDKPISPDISLTRTSKPSSRYDDSEYLNPPDSSYSQDKIDRDANKSKNNQYAHDQLHSPPARLTQDALRRHDSQIVAGGNSYSNGQPSTAASIRERRQSALGAWGPRPGGPIIIPIVSKRQGSMNWVEQSPLSDHFDESLAQSAATSKAISERSDDDKSGLTALANGLSIRRDSEPVSSLHSSKIHENDDEEPISSPSTHLVQTDPIQTLPMHPKSDPSFGHDTEQWGDSVNSADQKRVLDHRITKDGHISLPNTGISNPTKDSADKELQLPGSTEARAYRDVVKPDVSRIDYTPTLDSQEKNAKEKKRRPLWGRRSRQASSEKKTANLSEDIREPQQRTRSISNGQTTLRTDHVPFQSSPLLNHDNDWDPAQEHTSLQNVDFKMTKRMILKQHPHQGLHCTYAQIGDSNGIPVMVMLGLGVTRWMIGIYDDLAAALGLRLICIDRWGTGGTDPIEDTKRSLFGWSAITEEIASTLSIKKYSIIAHSAGAPYAIANAIAFPERVQGSIHLLAPWTSNFDVSQTALSGYSWVKFVPGQIIGSVVKAEWGIRKNNLTQTPVHKAEDRRAGSHNLASTLLEASANDNLTGSASDLLLLLRRKPFPPWGFSFQDVAPTGHHLKIWHGDRDEKISFKDSVRLLNLIGMQFCKVRAVPGADHSLMLRVDVIMEVFESIKSEWGQLESLN